MSNNNTVTRFFSVNPDFPAVPDSTKYIIDTNNWSCVPTNMTYQLGANSRQFICTYKGETKTQTEIDALMESMRNMGINNGGRRRTKRSSKRRRTNKRKSSKRRRTLRRRRH